MDPDATFFRLVGRAVRRRCSRCGAPEVFESWWELRQHCPVCGFAFERESGYWVGAVIINTAVTFTVLLAVLVGGMIIAWPNVPWGLLFTVTVAVTLATPIIFYPWSKVLWSAIELSYHPLEPGEREAAARRAS